MSILQDKEQIAPQISDDVKRNMDLLEKFEKGEIDLATFDNALAGRDTSVPSAIVEQPIEIKPKVETKTNLDLDNLDIEEGLGLDEEIDNVIFDLDKKPVSKSKKMRDRKKENILLDKMKIEQLEIEKAEQARQLDILRQQTLQHQQFIDQYSRQQNDSMVAANQSTIDRLEQELVQASSVYDSARIAKITSDLVNLRVQTALQGKPQQQYQQLQQNVPQQQYQQPSNDQLLVQRQIMNFTSKPEHQWTNTEFGQNATPLTQDARIVDSEIKKLQAEGRDWRTGAFWEIIEERLYDALPHRYQDGNSQVKSPPVANGAVKSVASNPNKNVREPIDIEVANIIKSAMSGYNGLKFKDKNEMRNFIRQTKQSLLKQRGLA